MGILQLSGCHFSSRLRCFLGSDIATNTLVLCPEIIEVDVRGCMQGDECEISSQSHDTSDIVHSKKVQAILLVRDDGVIYRTGFYARLGN